MTLLARIRLLALAFAVTPTGCGGNVTISNPESRPTGLAGASATGGAGSAGAPAMGSAGASGEPGLAGAGGIPANVDALLHAPTAFAIDRIWVGDTDASGALTPMAWQSFGADLDGADTKLSKDSPCALPKETLVIADGPGGIDNSLGTFNWSGAVTSPLLLGSAEQSDLLTMGAFSTLLIFTGAGPGGLYAAGATSSTPSWQGSDSWPVWGNTVNAVTGAPLRTWSSVEAGPAMTVVARGDGPFPLQLRSINGHPLLLPIRHYVITATVSDDAQRLVGGTIAGTLVPFELLQAFENSVCSSAEAPNEILDSFADMGAGDSMAACSLVSFGFGFTAVRAHAGKVMMGDQPSGCE